jgi:hypothetical protein
MLWSRMMCMKEDPMSTSAPLLLALAAALGFGATTALVRPRPDPAAPAAAHLSGPSATVGNGTARVFVDVGPHGEPRTLGIALSEGAMSGLATRMNSTSRCFDRDGDGTLAHGECLGDYQVDLALPTGAADLGLPVRWAMVNWNPEGHLHPAPPVWSAPHFDFHFYIADKADVDGLRPGPCGELIDCRDSVRASAPLPQGHVPDGYIDVGAAVPAMGNHLVDAQDPELADPSLGFSGTFIYGTMDGRLAFLEPMISHAFLASRPDRCTPLRVPRAVDTAGYYPTSYCVRYDARSAEYRVSLEGLTFRSAS